jgi:hypothetical protein
MLLEEIGSQIYLFHLCIPLLRGLYMFLSNLFSANMDIYPLLPSYQQGILTMAVGLLIYALVCAIYNVFFHPLSHFPGPRGAACTRWWLAYTELSRGVSLSTLREELHQKYGILTP